MIEQIEDIPTRTQKEVYTMDPREIADMQLAVLKQRFDELRPRIRVVGSVAEDVGITSIRTIEDIIPLCLPHTMYKSYSTVHIENGRYDRLTEWLAGLTSLDLSGVDVSGCDSLESWLDALEADTLLRPSVSSGTTGKISFYPRSSVEADIFLRLLVQALAGFGDEPDSALGSGEPDWFSPLPMATGRQTLVRMFDLIRRHCYGGDGSRVHTLGQGHWDADMLWLSGRMRAAEGRGETATLTLTPALQRVRDKVRAAQEVSAESAERFITELFVEHRAKRVILFAPTGMLIDLAADVKRRGIKPGFAPGSFILTGGGSGSKGKEFPEGWEELLYGVFPRPHQEIYGMTESTATCRLCTHGWIHWPPSLVLFLLDPDTGKPLPRSGVQTGRLALFDLSVSTHWGGAITGDQITVDWDTICPCGRVGPRLKNNVTRYSQMRDDDKITCSKSPGAYERAVENLIGVQ
jgi:hypothetical protein